MLSASAPSNTSGQGKNAYVPSQIRRWNWGAVVFSTIWALANGLTSDRKTFTQILKDEGSASTKVFFYSILGPRGNELAWKYRRWPSVEAFLRVQRRWSVAALSVLALFGTALATLFVAMLIGLVRR